MLNSRKAKANKIRQLSLHDLKDIWLKKTPRASGPKDKISHTIAPANSRREMRQTSSVFTMPKLTKE